MSERASLDRLLALALAAGYLLVLLCTAPEVGVTRDEGYYFRAAGLHLEWLAGLAGDAVRGQPSTWLHDDVIVRYWSYNHEHPVLMKTLFGLSWQLFHATLGWSSHATAYRLPAMLFAAAMVFLVFVFAAEAFGRRVAFFAVGAVGTIPRLFHDAHLACFDVAVATMQLLVVYAYWKGLRSSRWSVFTGLAFGLAVATKHNAVFIPAILGAHALLRWRARAPHPDAAPAPAAPLVFLSMTVLGPLVFYLHWPYLWHDPLARLGFYLRFHLQHVHYPVEYFGEVLAQPPFPKSFAFVMTWLTVPLCTVTLMSLAALRALTREAQTCLRPRAVLADGSDPHRTQLLLLLAGLVPLFVFVLPGVPIFGGVKHWFTAMPPLALLGAVEFDRLARWVLAARYKTGGGRAAQTFAAIVLLLPGVLGIRLVHPYGISFYNELIGSVRGAADHGMLVNFWGYTSRGSLAFLNAQVEPGGRVFFEETNPESYEAYRLDGLLRHDIGYAFTPQAAEWAVIDRQRAFADDEYRIWNDWRTRQPRQGVYVDEVPMSLVYRRGSGVR